MKSRIILFITCLFAWIMLTWPPSIQQIIVGVFAAVLVAFLTGDLFITRPYVLRNPKRYLYFIGVYIPLFLWEVLKANIDVAYRVLNPLLPINPGIVKVKTKLKSDTGITFLANSITLTPGTMSVDVDKDKGFLYIHWIDVKAKDVEDATRIIVNRFEKVLEKIFE